MEAARIPSRSCESPASRRRPACGSRPRRPERPDHGGRHRQRPNAAKVYKLKPVTVTAGAGKTVTVKVKLPKKVLTAAKRALAAPQEGQGQAHDQRRRRGNVRAGRSPDFLVTPPRRAYRPPRASGRRRSRSSAARSAGSPSRPRSPRGGCGCCGRRPRIHSGSVVVSAPARKNVTAISSNDSANDSSAPAISAVRIVGQRHVAEGLQAAGAEVARGLLQRRATRAAAAPARC